MIDEDLEDVLAELINISFGSATATIADLFDSFATLHVPEINFFELDEINDFVMSIYDNQKIYITNQQFKGKFQGEIVLVIDRDSAQNMQAIVGDEGEISENEIQQNILEISNILGSSCIGKLAELLVTEVAFAPPTIDFSETLIQNVQDSPYSKVILISTVLAFEDLKINGKLVILFSNEMFTWLEEALNNFLENI